MSLVMALVVSRGDRLRTGATRAEDAQGAPTQSRISASIQVGQGDSIGLIAATKNTDGWTTICTTQWATKGKYCQI